MKILGLDASLNGTAYAYYDENELVTHRITVKKLRGTPRVVYVRRELAMVLQAYEPDRVFLEGYSFGSKGRSIFDIGEMGGALKMLCYDMGIKVVLVPPSSLKLFMSGKGNAKKEVMAAAIQTQYGIVFESDDEADAFSLVKFGEAFCNKGRRRTYPEKVRDAIEACETINGSIRNREFCS